MKNNRLFAIIYLLLTNETMTAAELAAYFEVSTRTIYRDIDALSECHIPVYMSKGKNGGIRLLDNYKLDKALLSDEEQKQILFSLQSINKLEIDNTSIYEKLKQVFSKQDIDWFEVDFSIWSKSERHKKNFELLKNAVIAQQRITFNYHSTYGEYTKRYVNPYKLCFKHNAWYLYAYDNDKQAERFFKILRMKDIEISDEVFERKAAVVTFLQSDLPKYAPNLVHLQLLINKQQAYRIYDEFDEAFVKINEHGDFIINVEFPESEWIYGFILSFGNDVTVLSPEYVKAEVIARLKKSLNNYL